MLRIRAIKFDIFTKDELNFGNFIKFEENGLNIIKSSAKLNTSGKTTLFQSILYCLGFEQNIDGTSIGNNPLKPVLKNVLKFNNHEYEVQESYIYLEITNGTQPITIKRSVKSKNDTNLVTVIHGSVLVNNEQDTKSEDMFLHLKGSAFQYKGFHKYLTDYFQLQLPNLLKYNGDESKLYLQLFFAPFYIDQTRGWTEYLTPITNYGIIDIKKKIIEFLLDFQLLKNQDRLKELDLEVKRIQNEWKIQVNTLVNTIKLTDFIIEGLSDKPKKLENIKIIIKVENTDNEYISIEEYKQNLIDKLEEINKKDSTVNIKENQIENKDKLDSQLEYYSHIIKKYEDCAKLILMEKQNLMHVSEQIAIINSDLLANETEKKLEDMGSEENFNISNNICPTCKHKVESLLPANIPEEIMSLDKNIEFLKGQKKLFNLQNSSILKYISQLEKEQSILSREITDISENIKALKEILIDDSRLPSKLEIIEKLKLEIKLKKINEIEIIKNDILHIFMQLNNDWNTYVGNKKSYHIEFPQEDLEKIKKLEVLFRKNIKLFNFTSNNIDLINIDTDTYFPKINSFKLKSDSSASDFIRTIWAYYISLLELSNKYNLNHLGLIIIDEPAQQTVDSSDIHNLLKKINSLTNNQIIMSTSLKESEFDIATKDIEYNEIDLGNYLIKHL